MLTIREFADLVVSHLPYEPNDQQSALIAALARFCSGSASSAEVFILNGYAGTGKTSLVGALVKALREVGRKVELMAPTGRAAKVFAMRSGMPAHTIHRHIYRQATGSPEAGCTMLRDNGGTTDTVYIIDEASMIGADIQAPEGEEGSVASNLLEDLLQFVFSADNSRLILLGDVAQLPPVGAEESPAMQKETFQRIGMRVARANLTDCARQAKDSGILLNATRLRRMMQRSPLPSLTLRTEGFSDVSLLPGEDLEDELAKCYAEQGIDDTVIITRSNRRATAFNLGIRSRMFDYDRRLMLGERLMVAKNNYKWSASVKGLDFIANGDVGIITAIKGFEDKYGFQFADITLRLPDRDNLEIDCKIILDTLADESASLGIARVRSLAEARMEDPEVNSPETPWDTRVRRLRGDEYFNALQVKYAYAVTCHKAQGAQWSNVFVDLGGISSDGQTIDFYRWLYTATTRATRRLYYLNPPGADD